MTLLSRKISPALTWLGALVSPSIVAHEGHESGHTALGVFDDAAKAAMPDWVGVWLVLMAASFFAAVFFVRSQPIARWVLGGFLLAIVVSMVVLPAFGFERISGLIGLVHVIFWAPGLYLLLTRRPMLGPLSAFSVWSGWITFVILFSFVFDVRDAVIYIMHIT